MTNKIISDARNTPLFGGVIITLDGQEVTKDCQIADEVNGVLVILKRDVHGNHYTMDGMTPATEEMRGHVVISLREDAPKDVKEIYRQMREGTYNAR